MNLANPMLIVMIGGAITVMLLLVMAFSGSKDDRVERRLSRVGGNFAAPKMLSTDSHLL